jgi:prevent-host-death family protein
MATKRTAPAAPPTPTIQASTFKATCLEVMDDLAARGAELIVTKHGKPVVKVGPVTQAAASPFGFMRHSVVRYGDIVGPEHDHWGDSPTDPLADGRAPGTMDRAPSKARD